MKLRIPAIAALLMGCLSCVDSDYKLGGSLVPTDQTYSIYTAELPIPEVRAEMPDSLSGFSSTRITIGAVRDEDFGLSTRSCVLTLVPINDTLDFGDNPVVRRFHFSAAADTVSTVDDNYANILQNVEVYALDSKVDPTKDFDCNGEIAHGSKRITSGTPVLNGKDSLSFDFSLDYAKRYLDIKQEDLEDIETYLDKFPGIYITTEAPAGSGGRINMFDLQLAYDSDYYYLKGNYAALDIRTSYDGEQKDTTFYFYYSPLSIIPSDSLLTNYSTGSFPQYALNLTHHETRSQAGPATDVVPIEGGGGLKPMIKARTLIATAREMIEARGANPEGVVINKATIVMPFEFPADYKAMERYPYKLSPTCRFHSDTTISFMSLTDSSNEDEDQGDIDRSNLEFSPDITYHLQELLKIKDTDETKLARLNAGSYDIWFLIIANEVTESSSSSNESSDMSEYYQYLAYQSYYNSMYGGGYGYGGYGGYGGYNNYYTYMMMAQMYGNSGSTTSTKEVMDKDRYYNGWLNGPAAEGRVPTLQLTFSVPNEAQ